MNDKIEVKNISKSFTIGEKNLEVLRGLYLTVSHAEMIAITGVSGVGKSTLLHLLGTLDIPSSGEVLYDEVNPFLLSTHDLSQFRNRTIGFIFQAHHLLPEFTACENVMIPLLINRYSRKEAREKADSFLAEVELDHRKNHKPGELSGGEQQRVAVARSLVNNPKVIIADEPTGNLDEKTGRSIHNLLKRINKEHGITFIIATHNLRLASETDQQYQLIDGILIDDNNH
ncbi:ABC transporter ATP-binding protein [candidate division CSSED10-310 bacterium]|uniref:ABC transporter ATP-binding protein n=1 Tax=candidate division CSSED10-310 bacterium TaxID=2855610 RepID=A0ABV6YY34_UNCC1